MTFIHCKHYSGVEMFRGECICRAGINPVDTFCGGVTTGWVTKVPCLRTNDTKAICEQADYPTKEEEIADDAAFDAMLKNIMTGRPVIVAEQKRTGESSGTMTCPICAGRLRWSMSPRNKHIHAKCATVGCISWVE